MLYATVRQRKIHVKNPVTVIQNGIGVDWLVLDMDDEWQEMTSIVAVFTLKYSEPKTVTEEVENDSGEKETVEKTVMEVKEIAKEMLHTFGQPVQVPWECLTETGLLSVSCTGYVGSEKVMTTMMPDSFWNVVQNGPVTGDTPMEPTPTLYEQVLAAAGAANSAATQAAEVSAQLMQDKENGVFNGADGVTPTVRVGTVLTGASGSEAQVSQTGTLTDIILNFIIPRGLQGIPGGQGAPGRDGMDGYSPTVSVSEITGGHRITITDRNHTQVVDVMDGGMTANVYDPQGKKQDIFRYVDDKLKDIDPDVTADEVTFADGETFQQKYDSGELTGKDGEPGETGPAGRGVQSMTYDSGTNKWTITYTDGTTSTVDGPSGGSGGGSEEIFVATYGTTTCAELEAAYQAGKVLFVLYNNSYMPLVERYGANSFYFSGVKYDVMLTAYCSYNKWYNYSYAFLPYSEYSEYEFDQYAYRLGDVVMAYEYAPHHVSCLRNTKLVSSEEYPANEGEIFWQYE